MAQQLRMPPHVFGRILPAYRVALAMLSIGVAFGVLLSGHCAVAAEPDASDLPQAGRDIITAPDSAATGQKLFGLNCTYCHGAKGIGGRGKPLQCRDDLTAAIIFDTVTNGRDAPGFIMPSWKASIAEPDRWKLAAYILSLRNLPTCK
jgi:mono/diheme cytochrome c family protein